MPYMQTNIIPAEHQCVSHCENVSIELTACAAAASSHPAHLALLNCNVTGPCVIMLYFSLHQLKGLMIELLFTTHGQIRFALERFLLLPLFFFLLWQP